MERVIPRKPRVETVERAERPVITLENVGGDLAEGGYDANVVETINRQYDKTKIAATRVRKLMGETNTYDSLIRAMFELDHATRVKLAQNILMVGDAPGASVKDFVPIGSELELKMAQSYGRKGGLKEITRVSLMKDLIELGAGESGATVRVEPDISEKGGGNLCFVYGRPGEERAKFKIPLVRYSTDDLADAAKFFAELASDGHHVEACFGSGNLDFYAVLFGAALSGTWTPKTNRMIFTARPHSATMRHHFGQRGLYLLDVHNGPFKAILQAMLRHYSNVVCTTNPSNHLAWLFKNAPKELENLGDYSPLIEELQKCWRAESSGLMSRLAAGFIPFYNCLNDNSDPMFRYVKFDIIDDLEALLMKALDDLEFSREYRGSESGTGLSALLNNELKDVGTRPLGPICASFPDAMRRYLPALEEFSAMGVDSVSLYGAVSNVPIVKYARDVLRVDLHIYTTLPNTPFLMWNFIADGRHKSDKSRGLIIDCFPRVANQSGEVAEVTRWNSHLQVMEAVKSVVADKIAVFSRIISEKVSMKSYRPDVDKIAKYYGKFPGVGISFSGCRHHNGEYLTWLSATPVPPIGKRPGGSVEFDDCTKPEMAASIVEGMVRCVCVRIIIANHLRTWAAPTGAWLGVPPPVEIFGQKVDPLAYDWKLVSIRNSEQVRKEMSEIETQSSASSFGTEVTPKTDWRKVTANLLRKKTELPVQAEAVDMSPEDLARVLAEGRGKDDKQV